MNFNKKNVLLVFQGGNLGGAERQGLGLAKFLADKKGCKVDILFIYSNVLSQEFKEVLKNSNINKTYFFGEPYMFLKREVSIKNLKRLKWSLQYLLKLRKGLKASKHQVIIPFQNTPSKIAYYLYKLLPTAKYAFWHQLGLDILKHDVLESIAVNNIPCIIGNAENCLDIFKYDYKVKSHKLNLLPQYVSLQKQNRDVYKIKKSFKIPSDKFIFGMIAHFKSFKYHDLLLTVFESINQKYPNTHLILMGNKEHDNETLKTYNQLNKHIFDKDLRSNVSLLSNWDVSDVLNILDVGMLLSLTEGTPNVVMEYMLYGLPVICSNHPGCVHLLKTSTLLVDNKADEIYSAMERIIESKTLYQKESEANLERIKRFNVENYVKDLENILDKSFN
ncbi:glycosyltransferase family 4 protein [Seonamhaeicola sp.]|uniref:glycosyltransferase family 4 protein n=1 Tax=Seonamhaeicola sp. TaxID=1912245 RepID=UPI00262C9148|nr:glycosyltransferase family 4 protein [Seonamhaeicola sp.]